MHRLRLQTHLPATVQYYPTAIHTSHLTTEDFIEEERDQTMQGPSLT